MGGLDLRNLPALMNPAMRTRTDFWWGVKTGRPGKHRSCGARGYPRDGVKEWVMLLDRGSCSAAPLLSTFCELGQDCPCTTRMNIGHRGNPRVRLAPWP